MTKGTFISRKEVAEMTGFSVNYLATANGLINSLKFEFSFD